MRNRHLYPSNWERLAEECRQRAGKKCQICGIEQGALRVSSKGNIYKVYLQAAHKDHRQRHREDAELLCLCSVCHWYHDQSMLDKLLVRLKWKKAAERLPHA